MDGAAKFVKGDAVAGILILVINIIGGLVIGTLHDLKLEEAAEKYILLTVGDGLVAQIPSLLLAMATATIVTRISSDDKDLAGQNFIANGIDEGMDSSDCCTPSFWVSSRDAK